MEYKCMGNAGTHVLCYLLFINPVFMHSAAKKVQYPVYRDLLKVAWFNKMTVQVPKP